MGYECAYNIKVERMDDIMRRINVMRPYFSNVSPETFDVRRACFLRVNREKARETG